VVLFLLDGWSANYASMLERRVKSADTVASIQDFLKQLLHLEIPARLDQLKLKTQSANDQQTRDYTIEIVGYVKAFSTNSLLLRRSLELLRSMTRASVVVKYSADVCFAILEHSYTMAPELHADRFLFSAVRRLSFKILGSLKIQTQDVWNQWSQRLFHIAWFHRLDENLGSHRAQILFMTRFVKYAAANANLSIAMQQVAHRLRDRRDSLAGSLERAQMRFVSFLRRLV
jgi:hypothetical protein